jgi:hypothetical protein
MAVTDASPPEFDEAEHVRLTGTPTGLHTAMEGKIDAAQSGRRPATGDGAPGAR